MIKKIFITALFLTFSLYAFSQEILPLEKISQLDKIKEENSGKVVLYNFWASWCKPCVHEFPDLVKLYNKYKDKGFALIFISLDDTEEIESKVKPFLKKNNVDFVTYYNSISNIEDLINYFDKDWEGAIPSTYIYDKKGKQVNKFLGSREYSFFESEIKKYLK